MRWTHVVKDPYKHEIKAATEEWGDANSWAIYLSLPSSTDTFFTPAWVDAPRLPTSSSPHHLPLVDDAVTALWCGCCHHHVSSFILGYYFHFWSVPVFCIKIYVNIFVKMFRKNIAQCQSSIGHEAGKHCGWNAGTSQGTLTHTYLYMATSPYSSAFTLLVMVKGF